MTDSIYSRALDLFHSAHKEDPNLEVYQGNEFPSEFLYITRMIEFQESLYPDAGEILKLATSCQHLYRWKIPRNKYPMTKAGYYGWRKEVYRFQADEAGKILALAGYDKETINSVELLIIKSDLKKNEDAQKLEDITCAVFMKYYFTEFAKKHTDEEKIIGIIKKTWNKMSSFGQNALLKIELDEYTSNFVKKALS